MGTFKITETSIYRLAPLFLSQLEALTTAVNNLQQAADALVAGFVHVFALCFYDNGSSRFDIAGFLKLVQDTEYEKQVEKDIKEKHGIIAADDEDL